MPICPDQLIVNLSERGHPDRFVSKHWVATQAGDGREMFILSGIALINLQGVSSEQWRRGRYRLGVNLDQPLLTAGQDPTQTGLLIEQWTPLVTPYSIFNAGQSLNSGFAVDEVFDVLPVNRPTRDVFLEGCVAVRDSDAFLFRVGYHLTLLGTFDRLGPPL
jgi:hypothetical protein